MTLQPETTAQEVMAFLQHSKGDGAICPCCEQFVKVYKRPITSSMARGLIMMYKHILKPSVAVNSAIHIEDFFKGQGHIPSSIRGDISKLKYWGMIAPVEGEDGKYMVMQKAQEFIEKGVLVPKYAVIYNNRLLELTGEMVGIEDCLKNKFNYEQLMNNEL